MSSTREESALGRILNGLNSGVSAFHRLPLPIKSDEEEVTAGREQPTPTSRLRRVGWWLFDKPTVFWVALVIIVLVLVFDAASGGLFLDRESVMSLGLNGAVGIMLAVGMTFVLGAGELDLSLPASIILSSISAASVLTSLIPSSQALTASSERVAVACVLAALSAVATGTTFGFINGFVVSKMKINSFIATLGTGGAGAGLILVITNGVDITGFPPALQTAFGVATIGGVVPYQLIIVLILSAGLWYMMRRTRFGLRVLAMGSSRASTRQTGISEASMLMRIFVLLGSLAGIAGFFVMAQFATTDLNGNTTASLAAISAAVIGGTSLFGGSASIGGSVVAAMLPVVLASGLIIVSVPTFYQQIVVGLILILAVYVDRLRRLSRER